MKELKFSLYSFFYLVKILNIVLSFITFGIISCQDPHDLPLLVPIDPNSKYPVPSVPTSVAIQSSNDSIVTIKWNDNSSIEGGYEVERAVGEESFKLLTKLPPNTNQYTDIGIDKNLTYHYRVRGISELRKGEYSFPLTIRYVPVQDYIWELYDDFSNYCENVCFSHDGSILSWNTFLKHYIVSVKDTSQKHIIETAGIRKVCFSLDDKMLANSYYGSNCINIYDMEGTQKNRISFPELQNPQTIIFFENNKFILVVSSSYFLKIQLSDNKLISKTSIPRNFPDFDSHPPIFSNDGTLISERVDYSKVIVQSTIDPTMIRSFTYPNNNIGNPICFSIDSKYLFCSSDDGKIYCFDLNSTSLVHIFTASTGAVKVLSLSADTRCLLSVGREDKIIKLWNVEQGTFKIFSNDNRDIYSAAISPDGTMLAIGGIGYLRLRSLEMTWKKIQK